MGKFCIPRLFLIGDKITPENRELHTLSPQVLHKLGTIWLSYAA
jgi:hypothetical protein